LLLSGADGLSKNSLELESMLAVISNQFDGDGGDGETTSFSFIPPKQAKSDSLPALTATAGV
jgi:hypothetical protein